MSTVNYSITDVAFILRLVNIFLLKSAYGVNRIHLSSKLFINELLWISWEVVGVNIIIKEIHLKCENGKDQSSALIGKFTKIQKVELIGLPCKRFSWDCFQKWECDVFVLLLVILKSSLLLDRLFNV